MGRATIMVTGAAGFLGSAVTVDLAREHQIVAIDRRRPTDDLLAATPGVAWHQMDLADPRAVAAVFHTTAQMLGRVDFVLHFAAFHDFGMRRSREYERTNVGGTAHLLQGARDAGVKRFVFASSVAAMLPPAPGDVLTEVSPTADYIPYAASKSTGEKMVQAASRHLPVLILRIGGVFSDWCELPPLASLIRMWTSRRPLDRIIPGHGASGFPYLHRTDLVALVRRCLDKHQQLGGPEVLLACQDGAVSHKNLWPVVSRVWKGTSVDPWFMPAVAARMGVTLRYTLGHLIGKTPYEQPWMMKYIDRPWVVDTAYTRETLAWNSTPSLSVLERMPALVETFRRHQHRWLLRNSFPHRRQYSYCCAEL